MSYFVLKRQTQTFSYPHLDQTQSSLFIHLGTIPEAFPVFDLENHQEEIVPKGVPGGLLFPRNWISRMSGSAKFLRCSWAGSRGVVEVREFIAASPLSLTGSCKTFRVNIPFINAGLYNSGSMCGKQWTKRTPCNFCWTLCEAAFVVIRILSPVVVVSDMEPINYCSKPEQKPACGWDPQTEGQRVQTAGGSQTAWPVCSGRTRGKGWWKNLP